MTIETAKYISDLVETNPSGSEYVSQGDNHIRLIKASLKFTFPLSTIGAGLLYSNGGSAAVSVASADQVVAAVGSTPIKLATSLANGAAGTVVYQAAPGATSFASVGNGLRLVGGVLESTFSATPYTLTGAVEELQTATAGQTVFSIAHTYTPAAGQLAVFRNGQRLSLAEDYVETNTTTVTLTAGVNAGDKMVFLIGGYAAGLPNTTDRKVVIIGDSTTVNIPVSVPSWPAHFDRSMQHYRGKCRVVTLAAGGMTAYNAMNTAYYEGRTVLTQCIAEVPDIVIIQIGAVEALLNPNSRTIAQRKQDMADLVNAIHAGVPSAKIVYASQACYDSANFTPATLKNKGVMPYFFTLKSSGIQVNAYCEDMLSDSAGASIISAYADWVDWDTSTKALTNLSGYYTAGYWKAARLGCTASDGLHLSHMGHMLLAAYAVRGLRAQSWFTAMFPNFVADTAVPGEDPDALFSSTMTGSGDGYTWTQSGVGEDVSKGFGKARMFFPGSWYLPSKGDTIRPTSPTYNETSNLVFAISGGLPNTTVALSVDGAAFSNTKFSTTENGDAIIVLQPEEYTSGAHTYRLKTGNEVYGPYSITVTADIAPYTWVRKSVAGQSVPANTNTQVIFNQELYDTCNNYNTSTGDWICSKAGKYAINASVQLSSVPTGGWAGIVILLNGTLTGGDIGSTENIVANGSNSTAPTNATSSTILNLVVGDKIRITAWSDYAVTIGIGASANSTATSMSIRWLGY